jgi:hypothetical protein
VDWIERRLKAAQAQAKGTSAEVSEPVIAVLKELLADELQHPLKPEDMRKAVTRLAVAMREKE